MYWPARAGDAARAAQASAATAAEARRELFMVGLQAKSRSHTGPEAPPDPSGPLPSTPSGASPLPWGEEGARAPEEGGKVRGYAPSALTLTLPRCAWAPPSPYGRGEAAAPIALRQAEHRQSS